VQASAVASTGPASVRNVLIIDSDLGFVFWLGQALDAAGYETFPARGISEAVALLSELNVIVDILIVRYSLAEAATFAKELRLTQGGHLKTIALVEEADQQTASLPSWDGWQLKPQLPDVNAKGTFLTLVQGILSAGRIVPTT
jgi:hypothetical protein